MAGYTGGNPYAARPGPDDVAGIDPYTAQSLARLLPLAAANQGTPPAPQRGGRRPTIRIAPPAMSGNASRVMQSLMNQKTPNWGSALAKMANVAVLAHNEKKQRQMATSADEAKFLRRSGWLRDIAEGATPQLLAATDKHFLGDKEFHSFMDANQSERGFEPVHDDEGNIIGQRGPDGRVHADPRTQGPAPETFEDVASPYGFGGHAQRSSLSGKLSGYQSAPTSAKETARATATDQHGRLRYLDDGSPAFSDEILGPDPKASDVSMPDQLKMTRQLSDDWQKTALPMQDLIAQSNRMNIGFEQAEAGDMLSGSQAILISFNKLLDPGSVVRESEYARSATGQSALETLRGFVDKLSQGGAGVTLRELASYRRFGEQVVASALESTIGPERKRISRLAERFGVDPQLIFTGRFASDAAPQQEAQGQLQQTPQGQPQAAPQQQAGPPMYQGPSPTAPQSPEAFQPDPRAAHYSGLDAAQLRRQAATMQASPGQYNDAERRAMGHAWRQKFGE